MTTSEKLTTIAENEQKVHNAGKKAEYDAFWDGFQQNGGRTNYADAFKQWYFESICPKYPIVTDSMYQIFNSCYLLKDLPPVTTTKERVTYYNCFTACRELEEINMVIRPSTENASFAGTFNSCVKLKTINKISADENVAFANNTFAWCESLENLYIEGVIGKGVIDLHWSTKLNKASITSIVNALSATTSGLTVTISKAAKEAVFTAEEWATLIATKPNWTISLV